MSEPRAANIEILQEERVLNLVFCRPERKNALTRTMYAQLADAIEQADGNSEIRVILVRGAQGCFTSGNDLKDFLNNPRLDQASPVIRFMNALFLATKPVVAAVAGPAVGIGTTMLLHCDLVYAGEDAEFQLPFANLGLCPEYASSMLLPRIMGHARAAELLLLGETFDAHKAREYGLVNDVVSNDQLLKTARQRCRQLADQPPAAVRNTKSLMRAGLRDLGPKVMEREMELLAVGLKSEECAEAVGAFFDKRKPDFSRFS